MILTLLSIATITFPISGNKECQKRFVDGMLALHSFMYDDAHDRFAAAIKADPSSGCAMAHWGDAMSYNHPLWGEEEADKARASLASIKNEEKLTPKERAYLGAARALFGAGEFRPRLALWLHETEKMYAAFPGDDEVALQHALALVANSERLAKTKLLMESLAISTDVLARNKQHPGAAHYLIHAGDTADHAILALPAARLYAKIAPAFSHAQHMPSHIFAQLGMWNEVAASNELSWAAAEKDDKKRGKPDDERDWHSYSWLVQAYLELGQLSKAEKLMNELKDLILKVDGSEMRFGYALIAGAYLEQTGRWNETDAVLAPILRPLPLEDGEAPGSLGCANHAPGGTGKTRPPLGLIAQLRAHQLRARAAVLRGDDKSVADAFAHANQILAGMAPWQQMISKDMSDRVEKYRATMIAWSQAKVKKTAPAWDDAIARAKELADVHELGSPSFDVPGYQVLGEIYADAQRPKDAVTAFTTALERYPMHAPILLLGARAAKAAGMADSAKERYAALAAQWKNADANVPQLGEVRSM